MTTRTEYSRVRLPGRRTYLNRGDLVVVDLPGRKQGCTARVTRITADNIVADTIHGPLELTHTPDDATAEVDLVLLTNAGATDIDRQAGIGRTVTIDAIRSRIVGARRDKVLALVAAHLTASHAGGR